MALSTSLGLGCKRSLIEYTPAWCVFNLLPAVINTWTGDVSAGETRRHRGY